MDNSTLSPVTTQWKMIVPGTLNDHDTLFGGKVMKWMDETAYISATRFTREKMVTVSVEKIQFLHPVLTGTMIEICAFVTKVHRVKLEIKVEVYMEQIHETTRDIAITGTFIFAAINEKNRPISIKSVH